MKRFTSLVALILLLGTAHAQFHIILGKKLHVKDPTGDEERRAVIALGKESGTDIGSISDPTAGGATLSIYAFGTTDSSQSYVLDASGWSSIGNGFKYSGPTGGDGDPVKKVIIKSTPAGLARFKIIVKGNVGSQVLSIVPPYTGDIGSIFLTIGSETYCMAMADSGGFGTETRDEPSQWKLINATMEIPFCGS